MTMHIAAQTFELTKVRSFVDKIETWVVSNRYADRKVIVKSCMKGMRVNDELMQRLAEKNDAVSMNDEGYELDDYLNYLKNEMDKKPRNFQITFSNLQEISKDKLPKETQGCKLYSCTVNTSGSLDCVCEDVILVKKGEVCGIAKYIEGEDHKIHINFDDFINDYETIGFSYNYGQHFPIGGSFNYSLAEIPFMVSVDFGINLDGDKYIIDKVEMKDIMNYDRTRKTLDPKFFLTVTPQFYLKYFAIGCGVGFLWMDGTEDSANYTYSSGSSSGGNISVSISSEGGQFSEGATSVMLKPMVRPVAKGFIPLRSNELYLSVSVGYDLVFGYKDKNGFNFGLGLQWKL